MDWYNTNCWILLFKYQWKNKKQFCSLYYLQPRRWNIVFPLYLLSQNFSEYGGKYRVGYYCCGCPYKKRQTGLVFYLHKMKKIFYLLFIVSGFACCNAQQPGNQAGLVSFIKNKTDSAFNRNIVPGIFIGVINNKEQIYYNDGYASPDTKKLFDSATIFEIGSITKTFTAYVLMNVLKENKINDSSSILKYLPDSVQGNKALEKISFLSLMNHTSGLPRLPENLDLVTNAMAPYDDYTAANLFEYLKKCKPAPDGKSNYSNLGMGLAGVLAEKISGKTYTALLEENIFNHFKLGSLYNEGSKTENKSQGYFDTEKSNYWNMNILAPAGNIKSSAIQMLAYLQYMANPADEAAKEIIDNLLKPTVSLYPKINVCRAWHTLEEKDKPVIYWHNGGTYGFSTFAAFIKGQQKAVIVVVNKFNENKISDALGIAIMKELIK